MVQADPNTPLRVKYSVDDVENPQAVEEEDTIVETPSVEIVDDAVDDDPIDVLKRQFEDIKTQKEDSDRRAFEADRRNRENEAALRQYQNADLNSQKTLLEHAFNSEELKLSAAKSRYAESLRSGDYDEVANAQDEIFRTNNLMSKYADKYQDILAREKVPPQPQASEVQRSGDPFEEELKKVHPKVAQWAREHKDDITKEERWRLAYAADAMAVAKRYAPGSDEYFDFMDAEMGYGEPAPKATKPSRRTVAAPASRATSSSNTRRVTLNEDDKRMARSLSLTDVQYAEYKLKASDAQTNYGGRLHASYSSDM